MILDLVALTACAAVILAIGCLLGVRAGRQDSDLAVRFLRADNARLRALTVALQRELDAERSRRAPVLRVIRGSDSMNDGAA
jgi:hypothetical protein